MHSFLLPYVAHLKLGIVGDSNSPCHSASDSSAGKGIGGAVGTTCVTSTNCLYGLCLMGVCAAPVLTCPTNLPGTCVTAMQSEFYQTIETFYCVFVKNV